MSEQPNQPIQPQPVPTMWGFDHTPDGRYVVSIIQSTTGQQVYFISADNVDRIMKLMRQQGRACWNIQQNGLTVPPQAILGADGQPVKVVLPDDPRDIMPDAFGPQVPPSEEGKRHLEGLPETPGQDQGDPHPPTDGDDDGPVAV